MKNASRVALLIAILASPTIRATELPADLAKAVEDYDQAQIRGNRAELERLLADDYTLLNSGGKTETKSQFIAESTAPGFKLEPFVVKDATRESVGSRGRDGRALLLCGGWMGASPLQRGCALLTSGPSARGSGR